MQLLKKLVNSEISLTAILYYPSGQVGSTSPRYYQAQVQLSAYDTKGIYALFEGIIIQPPAMFVQGFGGASHIDVTLGTSRRSPKIRADANHLFATCNNDNMTTC